MAKSIEQQTAKLPSDLCLWAAIGSTGPPATLHLAGNKNGSVFRATVGSLLADSRS